MIDFSKKVEGYCLGPGEDGFVERFLLRFRGDEEVFPYTGLLVSVNPFGLSANIERVDDGSRFQSLRNEGRSIWGCSMMAFLAKFLQTVVEGDEEGEPWVWE